LRIARLKKIGSDHFPVLIEVDLSNYIEDEKPHNL